MKDVSVKRGYFQKVTTYSHLRCNVLFVGSDHVMVMCSCLFQSLVLVSRLPYTHLFHSLLQIIAPEFFEKLEPCLEAGDDVMITS